MRTDKFTLFVYCNFLILPSTTVCSQNINKQIVNVTDENLTDYMFIGTHCTSRVPFFQLLHFINKCQNVRKFLFKRQWFLYFILFFSWDITYMKVRKLINPKCISWLKNTKNPIFFFIKVPSRVFNSPIHCIFATQNRTSLKNAYLKGSLYESSLCIHLKGPFIYLGDLRVN